MIPFSANRPFPFSIWVSKLFWHFRTLLISHFHVVIIPTLHEIFTWGSLNMYAIYTERVRGETAQEGNRVDAGLQQSCYFAQIESQWHSLSISQQMPLSTKTPEESLVHPAVCITAESEDSMTVTSTTYFSVLLSVDRLLLDPTWGWYKSMLDFQAGNRAPWALSSFSLSCGCCCSVAMTFKAWGKTVNTVFFSK